VYALGATLAYAATGYTAPERDELPPPLRSLVPRCLARDPARRPQIAEVVEELANRGTPSPTGREPATRAESLLGPGWLPARIVAALAHQLAATGPRVIDFGIARPEHGLTLTTTGQIPVTPGYGAPEQVLGRRVTPAADIFSLGAVLVYAATGQRAFQGGHVAAVQYEVVHGEPLWHGLSPQLHTLIAPCLAKDEAVRPTAGQIAAAFSAPRNGARVWARGPVGEEIKARESRIRRLTSPVSTTVTAGAPRRRLLTDLAVGGAVLAAGGATTGWWQLREKARGGAGRRPAGAPDHRRPCPGRGDGRRACRLGTPRAGREAADRALRPRRGRVRQRQDARG